MDSVPTVEMTYKKLGSSALQISRIGFGCMSLKPNQTDIQSVFDAAIANGINFFDTADIYDNGLNETAVGIALKQKRKEVIIATKVGNEIKATGKGWDWNPSKKYIIEAVEKSLLRLQTDYIDLYQLHGGTIEDDIDDTVEAFETLQQQGKIRYYGLSSIRPNVIRAYVEKSNIVSVMMQYSLLDRRPEEECLELLRHHNIGLLARGSLAGGLLAGKPAKLYLNYTENEVAEAADAIKKGTPQASNMAATAIGLVLQHPAITSVVAGIHSKAQLSDLLWAIKIQPPALSFFKILKDAILPNYYDLHR